MEHGHILCSFARYYKPYPGVFVASLVFDTSDTPLKTNSNSPWKQAFLTQNTPKRKDLSSKPSIFSGKVLVSGRIQELWSEWWQRCHFCHPTIISSGEANHKPPLQKHTSIASRTTFKPFEQNISQQGGKSLQTRMSNLETSKDTPGSSSRCDVNFPSTWNP